MAQINILTAQANGNGTTITNDESWNSLHESHLRTLYIYGTFNTGNAELQISFDGTTWFTVTNTNVTVATAINVEFRAPFMRGVVAGGGGSESINMKLL